MVVDVDDLEAVFKALANANRLHLLRELRIPKPFSEIQLTPGRGDQHGSRNRPITRQAMQGHLRKLRELGLIREYYDEGATLFMVDHERMSAIWEAADRLVRPTRDRCGPVHGLVEPVEG